ncbi:MAG: CRISPR-associated endoribonuclease Cas6 [Thermoplasmatales archaeon]|nr:CRISPR-associated endoribonuclease Cas6 [Thermoplasmatales archaeon]
MRLILKLEDEKTQAIENTYHKLQGFVYKLIRNDFSSIHDKKGYKFFCFSNIFPSKRESKIRNFIISSPSVEIINSIKDSLEIGKVVNIGEMQFRIKDFSTFNLRIPKRNLRIYSSTPIIIRIPEAKYEHYNIPQEERKARYVYWRPKYSFEAFVKQLTENLIKKFNDFYGTEISRYDLFEQFVFKKSVANEIIINGKAYPVVGSIWEFLWSNMDAMQRKIIEFGIDTGLGERNSMGFGFVNIAGYASVSSKSYL